MRIALANPMSLSDSAISRRLLRREALQKKLKRAGEIPLTLVCAPAGYGKTTLVREALRTLLPQKVWIELDGRLALPSRFYLGVMNAIRKIRPEFCQKFTLDSQSALWPEPEVLLNAILSDLEASNEPLLLVFDDAAGDVAGSAAPELGRFLVQLPTEVHSILICRDKPLFNLNRWRMRGELLEITADELALSPAESAAFFREALGIELTPDDLAVVHSRCEGWVAGLQLLAMRLEREADPLEALRRLGGGHALLFEYLMEEVLRGLALEQREFLLDTSLLPRLHPDLCDAVTERTDSGPLLNSLLERNCFLMREEEGSPWFRYHRLFAEGLQGLLKQWKPQHAQTLHRRAARWHLSRGEVKPAMDHALAARDAELLDALAERALENIFRNSDFVTLHHHAALIPEELAQGRRFLPLFMAWAFFHMGREKAGERLLEQTQQAVKGRVGFPGTDETGSSRAALAHAFYLRGILLRLGGDLDHSIQILHRAVSLAPSNRPFLLASLKVQLGIGVFLSGRLGEAAAVLGDAMDLAEATSHHLAFYGAGYTYAELLLLQGNPARIHRHLARLFAYEALSPAHAGPASGYAHIARARALMQQGDDGHAQEHIERGIALGKRGGNIRILNYGYAAFAQLLARRGHYADATSYLDLAEDFGRRNRMHWGVDLDDLDAVRLRIGLARGRGASEAEAWHTRQRAALRQPSLLRWDACRTALRFLVGAGRAAEAHALATYWQATMARLGLDASGAEVSVALALVESQRSLKKTGRESALKHFEDALRGAQAAGAPAVFAEWPGQEGAFAGLLEEWRAPVHPGIARDAGLMAFAARLEKEVWTPPRVPANTTSEDALEESNGVAGDEENPLLLSDREIEVLRAMREGKSNKEIATSLFVAPSTVKTHLKHIFTKLQVSNRTRAVTLAEESGLLR